MNLASPDPSLVVVVGAGGVGKTTLAAALGLMSADAGRDTLVMTFDPSLRLKDALGVGTEAGGREVTVETGTSGRLAASLLDARTTFDRLVRRYAPDEAAAERILTNRFYEHLAGNLGGILEYMAVERLFEVASEQRYGRVILDTPPTRQALDFLEAPSRIVGFLDSGALRLGLRPWFDENGHLRATSRLGFIGRRAEAYLDEVIGLDLIREMGEFFQAFGPLYAGFRERAAQVQALLRAPGTVFALVTGPQEERLPEALFFARQLQEAGHHLGPIVVNMVHPEVTVSGIDAAPETLEGLELFRWLGARDHVGLAAFRDLITDHQQVVDLPLTPEEPAGISSLLNLGRMLKGRLEAAA
jgi:anion-transporting  ArsA/GET3 family ATPase